MFRQLATIFLTVFGLMLTAQTAVQLKNDSLFKVWALEIVQKLREDPQQAKGLARVFVTTADTGDFSPQRQAPFHSRQILAAIYGRTDEQDSAIMMQKQCLRYAEKAEDNYLVGASYHNIGVGYGKSGYLITAQEYLDSAILYRQKARNVIGLLHSYSLQMALLNDEEEHSAMLVIGRRALSILDTVKPRQDAMRATLDELGASLLNALGNAMRASGATDSALATYNQALFRCERSELEALKLDIEQNKADLFIRIQRFSAAEKVFGEMEARCIKLELPQYLLPITLGRMNIQLQQKRFSQAEAIWDQWQDSLYSQEDPTLLLYGNNLAEKLYRSKGQLDKAIYHADQVDSITTAVYNEKKKLLSQELSIRFDLKASQMNIAFQEEKIALQEFVIAAEKRRNWYLGIAAILFVLLFVLAFFSRNRIAQQKKKEEELNRQLQDLIKFQQQVSTALSHDIRNYSAALDIGPDIALRQIKNGDTDGAEKMLLELSDKLHSLHQSVSNILVWASPQLRTGASNTFKEIEWQSWSKKQLEGMTPMAESRRISLSIDGPEQSVSINTLCLEVVLRNAVFNAIKHSEAQNVIIRGSLTQKGFLLEIEDNGIGISEDVQKRLQSSAEEMEKHWRDSGSGFGLWIMRLYSEIANAELSYHRESDITRFQFLFPTPE